MDENAGVMEQITQGDEGMDFWGDFAFTFYGSKRAEDIGGTNLNVDLDKGIVEAIDDEGNVVRKWRIRVELVQLDDRE